MTDDELSALACRIRSLPPSAGATLIVAIDGRSGSGKTTFAEQLATPLGASVLSLEVMYPGWDGLDEAALRLVNDVLAPLSQGTQASIRRWDWEHSAEGKPEPVHACDILIVEGCGAGARAAASQTGLLVWMEAATEERYRRAMLREGDVYRDHWDRWAAQEDTTFAREQTRERADVIIATDSAIETA